MQRQMHKTLINAEKVIIAAVNGPAAGYGVSSIALCDLIYTIPENVSMNFACIFP